MKADVAIITALEREYSAFYNTATSQFSMDWRELGNFPRKAFDRCEIAINNRGIRIALVYANGVGQLQAATVTHSIIHNLSPQLILLVGIAAGIQQKKTNLGDVVIASQFIDYEMVKLTNEGEEREFRSCPTNAQLSRALANFRDPSWKQKIHVQRPDHKENDQTMVHHGAIFSGNKVVADDTTAKELLAYNRKAVGLEMESFGVAFALEQICSSTLFGMVKGISDNANSMKNDKWHEYATHAPAAFVLSFLQSTDLVTPSDGRTPITDINKETHRIIHDLGIDSSRIAHYEQDLIRNIVKATLTETNAILSQQYKSDIDHGQHFLLRAAPLFGKASEVYAVSLDTVSTFWVNEDNQTLAHTYLEHQAPNGTTNRLFVFSDAYMAHRYAKVLDYHCDKYRNVFVCSMQHYRSHILPRIRGSKSVDELLHRDFGLLMYEECKIELFAELNERSLDYKRIDAKRPEEINYTRLIQCFQQFGNLERGHLGNDHVLRWHQGFWRSESEWTCILRKMFDERTSDAFHLVFFNCDQGHEDELRAHLADIKGKIMNGDGDSLEPMGRTYGIRNVWFGRKNESLRNEPRDGKFGGDLRVNADAALFLLIMHFQDEDGLMRFYADSQHSEIRQNVYKTLDNRTHTLYELASNSKLNSKKRKKIIYEAIEALVSPKIMRRDYLNHEMIAQMVETTHPYNF